MLTKEKTIIYLIAHLRNMFNSLGDIYRSKYSSTITICIIAISLAIPNLFFAIYYQLIDKSKQVDFGLNINIGLQEGATTDEIDKLIENIQHYSNVQSIKYISSETALTNLGAVIGKENIEHLFNENPLSSNIVVQLSLPLNQEQVQLINDSLQSENIVNTTKLDFKWMHKVQSTLLVLHQVGYLLFIVYLSWIILVIGNAIRLAIINKKNTILVKKLIGATNAFVCREFLYLGLWFGLLASIAAIIIVNFLIYLLNQIMYSFSGELLNGYYLENMTFESSLISILLATGISAASAKIFAHYYVKRIEYDSNI